MFDLLTFGEAMVRFMPPDFLTMEQAREYRAYAGGSELNTAVGVSRLGLKAAWVSKLPDSGLGRFILNEARSQGVITDHVVLSKEGRAGLYFMEQGASPRPSAVLYDRRDSAFASFRENEADWDKLMTECRWVHLSGITAGLGPDLAKTCAKILKTARKAGRTVSYDLNYRSRLWTAEEARRVQEPMMENVDHLISTEEDIVKVFRIGKVKEEEFREVNKESYLKVAEEAQKKFGHKSVCLTLRENKGVLHNTWSAVAFDGERFYDDEKRELEVVDRIGAGDSFAAGFIYARLTEHDLAACLRFGNAFASLKHSIPGDFNLSSRSDTEALMARTGLRIRR